MADTPKRSTIDTIIEPFERLGSAGRTLVRGGTGLTEENLTDVWRALKGEHRVSPSDFKKTIEDVKGVDLTFGDNENPENRTTLENFGNFIADVGIDMLTSPDTLIVGPAKFLKNVKALEKVADVTKGLSRGIIGEKEIFRGAVGATMGAMNIDKEDSLVDAMAKISTGAAIGTGLSPSIKYVGKKVEAPAKAFVDTLVEGSYPEVFQKLAKKGNFLKVSEAQDIVAGSEMNEKAAKYSRSFQNKINTVLQDLYDSVGGGEAGLQAQETFRKLLGRGFSRTVNIRNSVENFIKGTQGLSETSAKARQAAYDLKIKSAQKIIDNVSPEIGDEATIQFMKGLEKLAPELADADDILRASTIAANQVMNIKLSDEVLSGAKKAPPSGAERLAESALRSGEIKDVQTKDAILEAFKQYDDAQSSLVNQYNKFWKDRGEAYKGFEKINFHTVDLKDLDRMMPEIEEISDISIGAVRTGAVKRKSGDVKAISSELTQDEITKIGARRYAALFLTEKEKQAKQVMSKLAEARSVATGKRAKLLRAYDDYIGLQKAVWLGAGLSWAVNTLPENIMKAYIASPSSALKAIGRGTGEAIYRGAYLDKLGVLKQLKSNGFYNKLLKTFDGSKDGYSLSASDPWLDVAKDLGVVDNTFVQEAKRGIDEGRDVFRGLLSTKNSEEVAELVQNLSDRDGIMRRGADILWKSPLARFTTGFENGIRLTTFKGLFDAELAARLTPSEIKQVTRFGPSEIFAASPARLSNDTWKAAREAMTEAAARTKDVFYDYGNVNAFEKYVAKRFIPFYSFISRDVDFWAREVFENPRTGVIESFVQGMGEEVPEQDRALLPRYMLDQSVRVRPSGGYVTTPSMPLQSTTQLIDELNPFSATEANPSGKLAPPFRIIPQFISNEDSFGRQMFPNENRPVVRVPDTALTALPEGLVRAMGFKRDPVDGRLYTNNKASAVINQVVANSPIDLPIFRQAINNPFIEREFRQRDNPYLRQISPIKEGFVTGEQMERNLRNFMRAQQEAENFETPNERRRGRRRRRR